MKKIIFLLIVFPLFITSNLNAQNLSKNEVFDVLSKWEGKWTSFVVFEESVWVTESFETRGISESNLILSNNYLEIKVYNGDETGKHIIRYDQDSKQFNRWEFKSDGGTNFWIGKWNQSKETMTWNYVDFTNTEIRGEINETFSSDNTINVNVVNNDSFNPNLSYSVTASAPSNGSVSVVDNAITYNPSLNYYGDDSFSYTVTQGSKSGTGSVTMSVSAVDDPPVLSISTAQSVDENSTPSFIVAAAQDVDGEDQTLTMSGTDSESFNLSSSNVLTFKEAPDFETKSSYTVTFTLTDGITEISEDVTFTILDINEQVGFEVLKQIEVIKTVE